MDTDLQSNKTKIEVVVIVVVIALLASILVFFLQKNTAQNPKASSNQSEQTKTSNVSDTGSNTGKPTGIFINSNEKNSIQNKFNQAVSSGKNSTPKPTVTYDFKYKIDPNLEKNQHSLLPFSSVYASTKCDLSTVPSFSKLYVLENHIKVDEAKALAEKNDIKAPAAAIADPAGFTTYVFTNPTIAGDYITIEEPSGHSHYHRTFETVGEPKEMDAAQEVAKKRLTDLGLYSNLIALPPTVIQNDEKHTYNFTWAGAWGGIDVIDPGSIKSSANTSVCDIKPTTTTNFINVKIAHDGTSISDIIDSVRKIKKTVTVPIQSLSKSLEENANSPILDPEVFSPTDTFPSNGSVIIDSVKFSFLDVDIAGLSCYIPTYITSGTLGASRVISAFPAVSLSSIKENCMSAKSGSPEKNVGDLFKSDGAAGTLNYSTFTVPIPTLPKSTGTGGCIGNLVDYTVSCQNDSGNVCNGYFSVVPQEDPFDTCNADTSTCGKPVENVRYDYDGSNDVCKNFATDVMTQNGKSLPSTFNSSFAPQNGAVGSGNQLHAPPGQVLCTFQTCKC